MPKYRLAYFNGRGRAEAARVVLAAAGQDYEDVRFAKEQWPAEKASGKYPFASLPSLEIDGGVLIAQSRVIARYLANEHGFGGKTSLDNAKIGMVVDACEDLLQGLLLIYHEKDETRKAEKQTEYAKRVADVLTGLEKMLISNKGGDGYFLGDEVTLADLSFFVQMEFNLEPTPSFLDGYPKLKALNARVGALPRIAAWLEKRPKTEF